MTELYSELNTKQHRDWQDLITRSGLSTDEGVDRTALIYDGDSLIATGSRSGNILKLIAVDDDRQGEDLTATVISALRRDAFNAGYRHLFLYTKPKNEAIFKGLFFYTVVKTNDVVLMEDRPRGIADYVESLPKGDGSVGGAIIMNANPFTKGHRYLIERAAGECERLYVFVVSEDKSRFTARDRYEMVARGVEDLENVTVLHTGEYLLSAATFPTYFLKDRENATRVRCEVDIAVFLRYIVPRLNITHRYVGEEPLSPMTAAYNAALADALSGTGVELTVIPRLSDGKEPISASRVRSLIDTGDTDTLASLLPVTTLDYLKDNSLI